MIYAHEPGEEVWFHYFWYPGIIPKATFEKEMKVIDFQIQKTRTIKNKNCRVGYTRVDYSGK